MQQITVSRMKFNHFNAHVLRALCGFDKGIFDVLKACCIQFCRRHFGGQMWQGTGCKRLPAAMC